MSGNPPPEGAKQYLTTTPTFIVGCRRSGTTLVSRIIDAHPAFSIYHESFLYPILSKEVRWYGDLHVPANMDRLIDDVREVVSTQVQDVPSRAEIRGVLSHASLSGVFGALLQLYARSRGKRRGGDKTPEHHRFLHEILRDFAGSPVIFTIRDPRDTVLSIRRVFDTSIEGAAYRWRQAFESYQAHADRVHVIRYESLVSEPETGIRALCGVLGEPFEEGMLEFYRHTPADFNRPGRAGGVKLSAPIDTSSIGQFRALPEHELRVIEAVCAEGMEAMGYAFVSSRAPRGAPPAPREGRWRRLADAVRYYGFHGRRWQRGAARWKLMARLRIRWLLGLVPRGSAGG